MSQRLPVLYNKKPCYEIVYEKEFAPLEEELRTLGSIEGHKVCIVTDSNVQGYYAEEVAQVVGKVASQVDVFTFPAGEPSKTLDTVKDLYVFLIEHHYDRKDTLLALGGGVVGDLTGYTAATYLRGISFIQVPTTLLAQVDSSIGGKTGVDFDAYKNMVGAFHMPILVYTNISVLRSLPDRDYYSGMAEVLKSGLIKDAKYYAWLVEMLYEICDRELDVLEELVYRCNQIKKAVVEKDPTEKGDRALLNLGHTIGHAIEKYMNFSLYHGECVALGTVAAAFISYKKGMLAMEEYYEIRDMFVPFNLPITVENIDPAEIVRLTKSDKKMENGNIKFILLQRVGKAVIDTTVTDEEMIDAIKEIWFTDEDMNA